MHIFVTNNLGRGVLVTLQTPELYQIQTNVIKYVLALIFLLH